MEKAGVDRGRRKYHCKNGPLACHLSERFDAAADLLAPMAPVDFAVCSQMAVASEYQKEKEEERKEIEKGAKYPSLCPLQQFNRRRFAVLQEGEYTFAIGRNGGAPGGIAAVRRTFTDPSSLGTFPPKQATVQAPPRMGTSRRGSTRLLRGDPERGLSPNHRRERLHIDKTKPKPSLDAPSASTAVAILKTLSLSPWGIVPPTTGSPLNQLANTNLGPPELGRWSDVGAFEKLGYSKSICICKRSAFRAPPAPTPSAWAPAGETRQLESLAPSKRPPGRWGAKTDRRSNHARTRNLIGFSHRPGALERGQSAASAFQRVSKMAERPFPEKSDFTIPKGRSALGSNPHRQRVVLNHMFSLESWTYGYFRRAVSRWRRPAV
uniref:Uncharacterized protein n=1 Tax=Trichuris muris TaxID=70415 RepID=A0A5S6QET5_TRIMR